MRRIGFTGTQNGMTTNQAVVVRSVAMSWKIVEETGEEVEFHHGRCIGADEQFNEIVRSLGFRTVGHPGVTPGKISVCEVDEVVAIPDTPTNSHPNIRRNHHIVDICDQMISTPGQKNELLRSGTWATIRYAVKTVTPTFVIYPDGTSAWR